MTPAEWQSMMMEAEALCQESKYFEAVQKIDAGMDMFETALGMEDREILKDPQSFLQKAMPIISEEQMLALNNMFVLRGDILVGLGATKRAELEYSNAITVNPAAEEAKKKKSKLVDSLSLPKHAKRKVPCTILTGFRGSGKTTLLNHILQANHGKRIAIIENEFGEIGVDDELLQGGRIVEEENILWMNDGCFWCTVRGDLISGLTTLKMNARKHFKQLDAIIIETSGRADPSPVAQTFFADNFVEANFSLDGILTLVDANRIIEYLDERKPDGFENEAVKQIAFADRILLNKCDLVDEDILDVVESRIRAINEPVPIRRTANCMVNMSFILGVQAFSLDKNLNAGSFLANQQNHRHDRRVSSIGIDVAGEVDRDKINRWIGWLLKEKNVDLFRFKAVLAVQGMGQRLVFQAIHMLLTSSEKELWNETEQRRCKMFFIGRNLNREELTIGFKACMVA